MLSGLYHWAPAGKAAGAPKLRGAWRTCTTLTEATFYSRWLRVPVVTSRLGMYNYLLAHPAPKGVGVYRTQILQTAAAYLEQMPAGSQPCAGSHTGRRILRCQTSSTDSGSQACGATPETKTRAAGFTGMQAETAPTWTLEAELNEELTWLMGTPAASASAWSYSCCRVAFWKVDWSMLPVKPAGRGLACVTTGHMWVDADR